MLFPFLRNTIEHTDLNNVSTFKLTRALLCSVGLAVFAGSAANAIPLDPNDFQSLGAFPNGGIIVDTNNLTINGNAGGVVHNQVGGPDIAVFAFDGGGTFFGGLQVTGNRPLALLYQGDFNFRGFVDVMGRSGFDGVVAGQDHGGAGSGVAGGHRGGRGGPFQENIAVDTGRPFGDGGGPGGGTRGASDGSGSGSRPGAGGAYGSDGGTPFGNAPGGTTYGDITLVLEGGSGGGGGGGHCCGGFGRGGGGGAIEIGALHHLDMSGSAILAMGGNGGDGERNGGGGSGGGILLHAFDLTLDSTTLLLAIGGTSPSGRFATGGCGGGGRIALLTNNRGDLTNGGAIISARAGLRDPIDCVAGETLLASASNIGTLSGQQQVSSIPEPMSAGLFVAGLLGLGLVRRQRRPA